MITFITLLEHQMGKEKLKMAHNDLSKDRFKKKTTNLLNGLTTLSYGMNFIFLGFMEV